MCCSFTLCNLLYAVILLVQCYKLVTFHHLSITLDLLIESYIQNLSQREGGMERERERGWESESTVMSHFVKLFNRHIVTLFKGETVVYYNEPTHHINLSLCCTHHSSVKSIGKPN